MLSLRLDLVKWERELEVAGQSENLCISAHLKVGTMSYFFAQSPKVNAIILYCLQFALSFLMDIELHTLLYVNRYKAN